MKRILLPLTLLASFVLASCSTDLSKIPVTSFAPQKLEKWNEPFDGIWVDPKAQNEVKTPMRTIYVAPVTTQYLTPPVTDADDQAAVKKLSDYFDQKLKQCLSGLPSSKLKIVNSPQKSEIIMEPALVQITPTKSYLNFCSFGTSLFVPYVSYAISPFASGNMVMVCKFVDTKTKKTIAVMADYRDDEPSVLGSLRDYTKYGHHYKTIDMWAKKMAERVNADMGQKVAAPVWITLNPF